MLVKMQNKFEGTMVGLACGDALGYPTEFMSMSAIIERYGPKGIQELIQGRKHGDEVLYTDDTQMSVAVAKGLIRAGRGATCDTAAPFVADEFVAWAGNPPGGHRAACGTRVRGRRIPSPNARDHHRTRAFLAECQTRMP